ncbi:terpenoid synthase [Hymenopellis radicata]|nr:terpenoid synthase [Hymenopellis radicata]
MEPQVNPAIVGLASASSGLGPSPISNEEVKEIRDVCLELLTHFKSTSGPKIGDDPALHDLCYQEVLSRLGGYPVEDPSLAFFFAVSLPRGVYMTTIAYGHVEEPSMRMYIAVYTAVLYYIEDIFGSEVTGLANFHSQFCSAESHGDAVLDFFASLLRSTYAYFDYVAANIIITSTLNFVTAMTLEHRTKDLKLPVSAKRYPKFSRRFSGAAEAYAFFIFPREVQVVSYLHAVPDLMVVLNEVNDVLSFYKEELQGEETNLVSTTACCFGLPKNVVLRDLSNEIIESDTNVLSMLKGDVPALKAYTGFTERYVAFHRSLPRYRLDELTADEEN